MGNVAGKLTPCLCPTGGAALAAAADISRRHDIAVFLNNPLSDEGLGHSFCYIKPDPNSPNPSSSLFSTISGASLSANTSTALSTALLLDAPLQFTMERASSFSSSPCFASVPLQPIPRDEFLRSGPIPMVRHSGSVTGSGPIERGFLSGPIERGFMSGPMVSGGTGTGTGTRTRTKLEKIKAKYKVNKWGSVKGIKESVVNTLRGYKGNFNKGFDNPVNNNNNNNNKSESVGKNSCSSQMMSLYDETCDTILEENVNINNNNNNSSSSNLEYENVQWAEGKAGEDRVQIVVSEEHGWVFVGIYDGFNGPDAPDFLLSNLYAALHKELSGLFLGNDSSKSELGSVGTSNQSTISKDSSCCWCVDQGGDCGTGQMLDLNEKVREKLDEMGMSWSRKSKHSDVLKALSDALRKTEEEYLDIADKMVNENPELFLMGSCVLAMLMIGDDVYVMNVGDSRAVLGRKASVSVHDRDSFDEFPCLTPLQLTVDHNTYDKQEVERIKNEHPDDPSVVVNDRVKGSLKVTRAFGAGYLKQPKWNDALLEMFRINYVGTSPYLTTSPSLFHHKLGPNDKFLILSSDGLYQYFTNEEAVTEVQFFMEGTPEGDPAQHLIEQVLFRAAKKSGMDFYELLDIPQGERRRYHDDVSIIVISLHGRIWRSSHLLCK